MLKLAQRSEYQGTRSNLEGAAGDASGKEGARAKRGEHWEPEIEGNLVGLTVRGGGGPP